MEAARVIDAADWRTVRNERREREFRNSMRGMGAGTREAALLKIEAMTRDLEHWHRKAATAQWLNARMLDVLRAANERYAESERLRLAYAAEVERLRGLIG